MIVRAGAGVGRAVEAEAGVGGQRGGGEGAGGLAHEEGPAQHRVEATMVRAPFWHSTHFPLAVNSFSPLYLCICFCRCRIPSALATSGADSA